MVLFAMKKNDRHKEIERLIARVSSLNPETEAEAELVASKGDIEQRLLRAQDARMLR